MGHIDLSADMATSKTVAQSAAYNDALTKIENVINGGLDSTNFEVGAFLPVTAGSSFPSLPADGQEYVYVADGTNGVFWRFRYYGTGAYWAFVGGPPLAAEVLTSESTSSASYTDLVTLGPSIVLPFSGDYDIRGEFLGGNDQGTPTMSWAVGATAANDNWRTLSPSATSVNTSGSAGSSRRFTGAAALDTIVAKYKSSGATANFRNRRIWVTPVKH